MRPVKVTNVRQLNVLPGLQCRACIGRQLTNQEAFSHGIYWSICSQAEITALYSCQLISTCCVTNWSGFYGMWLRDSLNNFHKAGL